MTSSRSTSPPTSAHGVGLADSPSRRITVAVGGPWPAARRSATRGLTSGAVSASGEHQRHVGRRPGAAGGGRAAGAWNRAAQWTSSMIKVSGAPASVPPASPRPPRTARIGASRRRVRPSLERPAPPAPDSRPARGAGERAAPGHAAQRPRAECRPPAWRITSMNGWYGTRRSSLLRPNSTRCPSACARRGHLGGESGLADARLTEDPDPADRPLRRGTGQHVAALAELGLATAERAAGVGPQLVGERRRRDVERPDRRSRLGSGSRIASVSTLGDEPVAAAVHRLDRPLCPAVVVDRPAGLLDAGGQRRLGDEPVAPDVVEQLLLGARADRAARPGSAGPRTPAARPPGRRRARSPPPCRCRRRTRRTGSGSRRQRTNSSTSVITSAGRPEIGRVATEHLDVRGTRRGSRSSSCRLTGTT